MSKIYGYCRVSSKKQLNEGNGLDVQEKEILEKYENAIIRREQFTGATVDRPIFQNVIEELVAGDTLVVTKLDRLARNTVEGIEIVQQLFNKGAAVHVLNVGLLENTSMGKFFLTTLLAVAEMERNTILERTQAGKEIARTKEGYKEGRPQKYTPEQLEYAMELLKTNSYTQVEKMTQISKSTLTREARKRKAEKAL
ncbi:recombinase family protein [Clostridium botulinum]|nr:recombinase family protein [Clostridium botulinum]NFM04127.1 recombinase family protein [Clostridium botulinum]